MYHLISRRRVGRLPCLPTLHNSLIVASLWRRICVEVAGLVPVRLGIEMSLLNGSLQRA